MAETISAKEGIRARQSRRLRLRIYGMGVLTMVAVGGTLLLTCRPPADLGRQMAAVTTYAIASAGEHFSNDTLVAYVEQVHRDADAEISIYDPRWTLVATNVQPALHPPMSDQKPHPRTERALRDDNLVVPIVRAGVLVGYGVGRPSRPQLPRDHCWDIAMTLVWSGLAALLFSKAIGEPPERIAAAARAFENGDLSVRAGVNHPSEIGSVSRALDEMSDRNEHLMDAQRELLASVSHELRTPLARIRVAIDLAAEGNGETARDSLIDVSEDLAELERLIGDIFSAARLDQSSSRRDDTRMPLTRTSVSLDQLVTRAVGRLHSQYPERAFTTEISSRAVGILVECDVVLLRRAIENVLDNAHKYSPVAEDVFTRVGVDAEHVVIDVVDHGFGISSADLPFVFSPFFRTDRSRARTTGGVGMGLALAKRVVEAHGGHLELMSELDVGTIVTCRLPVSCARTNDEATLTRPV